MSRVTRGVVQGMLERRGTGVVGRWDQLLYRLDGGVLDSYEVDAEGEEHFKSRIQMNTVAALNMDEGKCELTFIADGNPVRLRASTPEEAASWYSHMESRCQPAAPGAGDAAGGTAASTPSAPRDAAGDADAGEDGSTTFRPPKRASTSKPRAPPVESEKSTPRGKSRPSMNRGDTTGTMDTVSTRAVTPYIGALEAIQTMVLEKKIRVADIFRSPEYNPSYARTRDEQLDAGELYHILLKAGAEVEAEEVEELVNMLDKDGNGQVGIRELSAALRKIRRGNENFEEEETAKSITPSRANWKRASTTQSTFTQMGEVGVKIHRILAAVQQLVDEKHMRISDLFRHPHFNPSYQEKGDETLDADEIRNVLLRGGVEVDMQDVKALFDAIDADGSGAIDILELELALRKHRRGQPVGRMVSTKTGGTVLAPVAEKAPKRAVNLDRLKELFGMHDEKLHRLEEKRMLRDQKEDEVIAEERRRLKIGSRANLHKGDLKPAEAVERLYKDVVELEHRRHQLTAKLEEEERRKVEAGRATPRHCRPVRSHSEPRLASNSPGGEERHYKHIGERLHALKAEKEEQLRRRREQAEAEVLVELDKMSTPRGGYRGNPLEKQHQLYEDAKERKLRLERQRLEYLEQEQKWRAASAVGRDREPLTDLSRIEQLYQESLKKTQRRAILLVEKQKREHEAVAKASQTARAYSVPRDFQSVRSRARDAKKEAASPSSSQQERPKIQTPRGFGSGTPRQQLLGDDRPQWCIAPADHALQCVIQNCALRTNLRPEDCPAEVIGRLIEPLEAAMQEYRDAAHQSELNGEGHTGMRRLECRRLFSDGCLLEDPIGRHQCCEPDPLRQTEDNFDTLMEMAERAQVILLAAIGPESGDSKATSIGRRWPKGAKWNHPRATKKAQFAYNPGTKDRELASYKAFVRYAPADREKRHRHLTDLARVGLVFTDSSMLKAGLEQIIERFEVIDVRNHYHPTLTSLLGPKFVEVLIVLKIPEPFICEIRLEEFSYFLAREKARPHVETIAKAMAEVYNVAGADPAAIEYLTHWVLHKPKEGHATTIFKKHIARRYGSTVIAWRRALGNGNLVPFLKFREACQDIHQRERSVEFWQELDSARGGCISLFELDPEAVVILTKFYWRIMGLATPDQLEDPEKLFARLTSKSVIKLNRPGHMEAHEFRRVTKPLGFNHIESDRMFTFLDAQGGEYHTPPATIIPSDIAWLKRLPQMVDIDAVMLKCADTNTEMESLRAMTYAGRVHANVGSRARTPAGMLARQSMRGSVMMMPSGNMPRASLFARRSVSSSVSSEHRPSLMLASPAGAPRGSVFIGRRSHLIVPHPPAAAAAPAPPPPPPILEEEPKKYSISLDVPIKVPPSPRGGGSDAAISKVTPLPTKGSLGGGFSSGHGGDFGHQHMPLDSARSTQLDTHRSGNTTARDTGIETFDQPHHIPATPTAAASDYSGEPSNSDQDMSELPEEDEDEDEEEAHDDDNTY